AGAAAVINNAVGKAAFRPVRTLNAAVLDGVMVGVMKRLAAGPIEDLAGFKTAYDSLAADQEFAAVTGSSTAAEESVRKRISLAAAAFHNVA
ncbi:MAG: hypothetical protein ACTHOK_10815, partial [Nocardioidaceae bacterium]